MGACALSKDGHLVCCTIFNIRLMDINSVVLCLDSWTSCVCDHAEKVVIVLQSTSSVLKHKMEISSKRNSKNISCVNVK